MTNQNSSTVVIHIVWITTVILSLSLIGCGSSTKYDATSHNVTNQKTATTTPTSATSGGGYYLDDGPGANPPPNLDAIPDAVPKVETLRTANMRPYTVLGKSFQPLTTIGTYKKRGVASWYGRRYHGRQTASGEIYNMYAMTAAHPTLPLPSYAQVTNLSNGRSVIVRINDRGPFLASRIIDLSYTAAHKLDILAGGHASVEVKSIIPGTTTRPAAATITTAPTTNNSQAIYLQLAAFGTPNNARNFLSHMQAELPWLVATLGIKEKRGLYKIKAGPFANRGLAKQAADRITQQLTIKPMLLMD